MPNSVFLVERSSNPSASSTTNPDCQILALLAIAMDTEIIDSLQNLTAKSKVHDPPCFISFFINDFVLERLMQITFQSFVKPLQPKNRLLKKMLQQFATNLSSQCFFKGQCCFKSPPTIQPTEGHKNAQTATFDSPFWDVLPTPCNCDNVLPWRGWVIFKCIYTIHKAFLFHQLLQALC